MKEAFSIIVLLVMATFLSGCLQKTTEGIAEAGAAGAVVGMLKQTPETAAAELINSVYGRPGTLETSKSVWFEKNYALSAEALSTMTSLSKDRVCFSLGGFSGSGDFRVSEAGGAQSVVYSGPGVAAKLKALCYTDVEGLLQEISGNGLEAGNSRANCESLAGRGCLIYLERA